MSLSLVYRAARPSLWAHAAPRVSLTAVSTRHASLSAIHRGLVRSEKARPQGARSERISDLSEGAKRLTYAERQKAREQLAKERPDFKIRKGKKDITEYPDQAKPKSRQARFYDPESSFGKKSLVYQLKAGNLRDELKTLQGKDRSRSSDSPFQRTGPRPDLRPPPRRAIRRMARSRDSRRGRDMGDVMDPIAELSRPAGASRAFPRRDADGFEKQDIFGRDRGGFGDRDGPRTDRATFRNRETPSRHTRARGGRDTLRHDRGRDVTFRDRDGPRKDRDTDRGSRDASSRPDKDTYNPRKDRDPISIPYTTAASQFLYGKSVVEAALRSTRRKLYKLYIYGGANRQNAPDDALIQQLAKRKGIPTEILGEDGLRLMDKMSSSRPHNGFVLEASALPQPPLTALGPMPEDYLTNPGYPVTLGHQSAEEAAVNGTPSFIPSPTPSHKPLVVILDQILDPGNLGAILRTVSFLGASAVGITRKGSATLTPVALKASAGASETLTLFSIPSLPEFLNGSRANGWAVYAAVARGAAHGAKQRRHMDLHDVEAADPLKREPCVLVVGNEGEGLSRLVVKKADYEVNIPNLSGSNAVDSLNVSVAAGLLCSAFLRGVVKELEGFGGVVGEEGGEAAVAAAAKESLW